MPKKRCPDRIGTRAKCSDRTGTHFYACIVVSNAFRDVKSVIFRLEESKFKKKCPARIGTGSYSIGTTEKTEIFNQKNDPKEGEHLILMCIFLNNVSGSYSIGTPGILGF